MKKNTIALALSTSLLAAVCWAAQDTPAAPVQGIPLVTADASAAQTHPDDLPLNDEELLKRVAPVAHQAAGQVGARIEISVQGGDVLLTGSAPNDDALRHVADEVTRVPGIKSVRTDVEIKTAD